MKHLAYALAGAALALLTQTAGAQQGTTGVPWVNNFCIGPAGFGGTSCIPYANTGGGPDTLTVECAQPGLPVFFFWSGPNPCSASSLCLPASTAAIPFTACGGATNQSIDILPNAQPPFTCTSTTVASLPGVGICTLPVNLPPGITFSMQAVILDPVNGVPLGNGGLRILMTQAFQVIT